MNRFFGVIADGQRVPVAGVSLTAGGETAVTDSAGRYEIRSSKPSLPVTLVRPPAGYEGGSTRYGTLMPGQNDLFVFRLFGLSIAPPQSVPISDGTRTFVVSATAEVANGQALIIDSNREFLEILSSNPAVLRVRRVNSVPMVEGVAAGTATITATYWGFVSQPATVTVFVPTFKFAGQILNRQGVPLALAGVEIRTDRWSAVTDTAGRYQANVPLYSTAALISVTPPVSYVACRDDPSCRTQTMTADRDRNFSVWRVASFDLNLPEAIPSTPGRFVCLDPRVHFDGDSNSAGWGGQLPPGLLQVTSSNLAVAKFGPNVECTYGAITGLAPGVATITLATMYNGVPARPQTVQVVP